MIDPTTPLWGAPRSLPPTGLLAALALYAVVAGLFDPYTWPIRVATAVPCAAVLGVAIVRAGRWSAPSEEPTGGRPSRTAALVVWTVLLVAVLGFQLHLYVGSPREVYPTLSSLAGAAFQHQGVRPAAFGLWLALGWYLVER